MTEYTQRTTICRAIAPRTALAGGFFSLGLSALMLGWQARGAERNLDAPLFFFAWCIVFVTTAAAGAFFLWTGARQRNEPMISPVRQVALRSMFPPMFAGGVISACLSLTSDQAFVPVIFWLVFYGLALLSPMAPGPTAVLGWAFLVTGLAAFIYFMNVTLLPFTDLPTPTRFYPAAIMGATFGLYHLVFAACAWFRR